MPARKPKPIAVPITATDKISKRLDKISSKIERLRQPIDKVRRAFKRLDKAAGLTNIGASLKRIGGNLTRFVTLPLAAAGAASIKFATDFNKELANVGTLIPGQIKRLKQFKNEVRLLSIETGKTTEDLGAGLYQVISAFGDSPETFERLRVVSKAAVAGVAETTDSLNLLSAVTKAYDDTSVKALKTVSDLAFKTVELGQTTYPEMAQAIRGVTSLAVNQNVKMNELFGTFATGTGVTGNAAEVATQLNALLKAMAKPSKEMLRVYKSLNVETGAGLIKQVGFRNALFSIKKAAEANKLPLIKLFGRIEGFKLMAALTGAQAETFTTKMNKMKDVTGATEKAFKEQTTEGINKSGFALLQLKARVIIAAQKIGDDLAPAIMKATAFFGKLFTAISNMNPAARKTIIIIGAIVAFLGPLIFVIGTLISALGILGPAFIAGAAIITGTVIPAVLAFTAALLTNPIFLVATGIMLVIGLLVKFTKLFDPIVNKIKSFFGFIDKDREIGINGPDGIPETIGGGVRKHFEERETRNINRNEAVVKVDFENAPKGTNVSIKKNKGVALDTNLGLAGTF